MELFDLNPILAQITASWNIHLYIQPLPDAVKQPLRHNNYYCDMINLTSIKINILSFGKKQLQSKKKKQIN